MKHLGSASILALCAMASPALADVTPQQVWDNLEAYMVASGYTVTGSEAMSGDTLTVSGITLAMDIPEAEGNFSVTMSEMTFKDKGDGTVAVMWPETMPLDVKLNIEGDEADIGLDYLTAGLDMTASGTPEAMTYDFTADSITLALAKLMADGEEITRDMATFELAMNGLGGTTTMSLVDGLRMISQTLNGTGMTVTGMASEPGTDNGGNFSLTMGAFKSSSDSAVPAEIDYSDMPAMLAAGFAGAGEFSHSGLQMAFDVNDRGDQTNGSLSTTSGRLAFAMSEDAMSFSGGNTGMEVAMQGAEIPLPISGKMAETSFNVAMPLQKSDTPQDAAIGLTLGGFETSDMIWGMLDPGGVLPRDPATVSANLTAKVTPFISLLNEEDMMKVEMGEMMPGELNAATLTNLTVEAAGGKITGDGDFTFNNADLTSFDGFPAPEGKLNLSVSGANGLIDKIIAMGLMSQEDAMGARMMLSMFTVPGADPDSATSTIEFNDQGHILANGQRIK